MTTERKPTATPSTSAASTTGQTNAEKAPIIVDIGKGSRKDVRKLKKGQSGKLMRRLGETVEHLRESEAVAEDAQIIVLIVRQRPRRRAKFLGLG
jgi:hypothetical protein